MVDASSTNTGIGTRSITTFRRGTSFAQTSHPNWFTYNGGSVGAGNVYNGARYISAQFKYVRNGNDLISWQTSNAKNPSGCTWTTGPLTTNSVTDTLDPNAPQTQFRYNFATINPNVC